MGRILLAVLATCLSAAHAVAADESRCESDFGELASAVSSGIRAVWVARSERAVAEQWRRELQDCLLFTRLYDARDDQCLSATVDYGYAKRGYEIGKGALRRELEQTESKLQAIEESCGDTPGTAAAARIRAGRTLESLCRILPAHPTQVVPRTVLETCRSAAPPHK